MATTKSAQPGDCINFSILCNKFSQHKNWHRAIFCKQAIALAINIKNHFERVLNQQVDRNVVIQIQLPYPMPFHLRNMQKEVTVCELCVERTDEQSDTEILPNAASVSDAGNHFFLECARCIRSISYETYARSILLAQSKTMCKKRASTARCASRKRSRVDDDDDDFSHSSGSKRSRNGDSGEYNPMDCMHKAVGLQHARRALRSSREAAANELSSFDFDEAGSALLLEIKESVQTRADGDGGAGLLETFHVGMGEALPTHGNDHRMARNESGLNIATSPYAYSGSESSFDPYAVPHASPGASASLQEFLAACYRDGIYPSPIMHLPASFPVVVTNEAHVKNAQSRPIRGSSLSCVGISAGTEVDGSDYISPEECVEDVENKSTAAQQVNAHCTLSSEKNQEASLSSLLPGSLPVDFNTIQGESQPVPLPTLLPLSLPTPLPAESVPAVPSEQPVVFAYDELQQLLTHLLNEAH